MKTVKDKRPRNRMYSKVHTLQYLVMTTYVNLPNLVKCDYHVSASQYNYINYPFSAVPIVEVVTT